MNFSALPSQQFDLFVQSAHGAGAHAIFRYLERNPRIFPIRIDTLAKIPGHPLPPAVKGQFGARALTAWVFADMNQLIRDPSASEQIKSFVSPTRPLVHLVRDPIRQLLSVYNVRMHKSLSGIGPPPLPLEQHFTTTLATTLFHRAGSMLAPHFSEWMIIDTSDITGERTAGTLRTIFHKFGVETAEDFYSHPSLFQPQNDIIQSLLRNLRFEITILGVKLNCLFQSDASSDYVGLNDPLPKAPLPNDSGAGDAIAFGHECEVGTVTDIPAAMRAVLNVSSLRVMAEAPAWFRLHPKIRALLRADNQIGNIARKGPLAALGAQLGKVSTAKKVNVEDLPDRIIAGVKTALADDIHQLFEQDPSLRRKWDICGDV